MSNYLLCPECGKYGEQVDDIGTMKCFRLHFDDRGFVPPPRWNVVELLKKDEELALTLVNQHGGGI